MGVLKTKPDTLSMPAEAGRPRARALHARARCALRPGGPGAVQLGLGRIVALY